MMSKEKLKIGLLERYITISEVTGVETQQSSAGYVSFQCPYCSNNGTFGGLKGASISSNIDGYNYTFNINGRRCPNQDCGKISLVISANGRPYFTFPAAKMKFDTQNVPERIASSLDEALICHANDCHRASALMIRRALEELCDDRSATGSNLKKRIQSLGSVALIPKALMEALDQIRLLGNDAAHVEAKDYDNIGEDEVNIALILAQELVKAVYQYENLLEKIKSLKSSKVDPSED